MSELAAKFLALFRGFERGHGTYGEEDKLPGKHKTEIKRTAKTIRDPVTESHWEQHLRGERPLGVIPITTLNDCWWGAIDIDNYDVDHAGLVRKLREMGLPMFVCKSKSGGAHIYVFFTRPIPARDLITKLRSVAATMGYGQSEIFPKQAEVAIERGDIGNWINMPYFGEERYAVTDDGRGMSAETFVDAALRAQTDPDKLWDHPDLEDPDLREGPPCLEYLAKKKVSEGQRNKALFAFGIFCKKKFPIEWEKKLEEMNQKFIRPPIGSEEVVDMIRNLRRKEYVYSCRDTPICMHCDSRTCRTRRYGVSGGSIVSLVSSISILDTDPPLFFVNLEDGAGTIECQADDILFMKNFQKAALVQKQILIPPLRQQEWQDTIQKGLAEAVKIEAPYDSGTSGVFIEYLTRFCTDRHRAQTVEEILLGKPFYNDDLHSYMFRLSDLMEFLDRYKFRELTRPQVVSRLKILDAQTKFMKIKGRGTNIWYVPASKLETQSERFLPPETDDYGF